MFSRYEEFCLHLLAKFMSFTTSSWKCSMRLCFWNNLRITLNRALPLDAFSNANTSNDQSEILERMHYNKNQATYNQNDTPKHHGVKTEKIIWSCPLYIFSNLTLVWELYTSSSRLVYPSPNVFTLLHLLTFVFRLLCLMLADLPDCLYWDGLLL